MPIVAVLPVKSFSLGKGRMSTGLTESTRVVLGMALAEHTAGKLLDAGLLPLLVAGDSEVAEWSVRQGLASIPDPGSGLNDAAGAGVAWAKEAGCDWLVIHADLPLLSGPDLEIVLAAMETGPGVISPSADGGTSLVSTREDLSFQYGAGSFHRHLAQAPGSIVVATTGLLHDVDSIGDLESARAHTRGRWLQRVLS
ncbi:MAG: 2-phospho-L-lactate guanylyltransferase [Acidimicrobiia bacterium]